LRSPAPATAAEQAVVMDRWAGVPHVEDTRMHAGAAIPAPRSGDAATPKTESFPDGGRFTDGGISPGDGRFTDGGASPDDGSGPDDGAGPAAPHPQEATRMALVAEHTGDALVIYRPDGRIDWVNDAFVRMTGYDLAEVVGVRRLDLVRGPFTRSPQFAQLADDLAAGRDTSVEFVTRTKSGTSYWVEMEVRAAVRDGTMVGLVGVERDVTQRRTAQERVRQTLRRAESLGVALRHEKRLLSAVLGTIPHMVWWKNADLRYVGANQAYLAFRGLGSVAELVGRLEEQLDPGGGLGPAVAELEAAVVTSGRPIAERTLTLPGPGGRPQTFLANVLPHLEESTFVGVIGILADVSKVADLERQLAQASRLESLGQLAAGVAHEINTPVQYVSDNTRFLADAFEAVFTGLSELTMLPNEQEPDADALRTRLSEVLGRLDLDFLAEEVPGALGQSLEGLERVSGIVRAMKDFSHPGQGRADVDLNHVVETVSQVTRNEWRYVSDLELELDPDVGQVPCYQGELKQVLLNMIVNAVHAITERQRQPGLERTGSIRVRTQRRGDEVLIMVQDDGIGMDEATKLRVFDPFFTTKPVGQGTGQGMNMAHAIIVQKHGGRIEIDSEPGVGTTFTVVLPGSDQVDPGGPEDLDPGTGSVQEDQ
jgi:PAS domain S-box-containing protein